MGGQVHSGIALGPSIAWGPSHCRSPSPAVLRWPPVDLLLHSTHQMDFSKHSRARCCRSGPEIEPAAHAGGTGGARQQWQRRGLHQVTVAGIRGCRIAWCAWCGYRWGRRRSKSEWKRSDRSCKRLLTRRAPACPCNCSGLCNPLSRSISTLRKEVMHVQQAHRSPLPAIKAW